jgi:glutamate carboxypeptidase
MLLCVWHSLILKKYLSIEQQSLNLKIMEEHKSRVIYMNLFSPMLDWIHSQQDVMLSVLKHWTEINSSSDNLPGLNTMIAALKKEFAPLQGEMEEIPIPSRQIIDSQGNKADIPHGHVLHIRKHSTASIKVFLGGHMDTVYPSTHPFQKTAKINNDILNGPGVADMKGGLMVMLKALEGLERSPLAGTIGWEIVINSDEEVGSVGSHALLIECAKRNHLGLIFEPAYSDGALVSSRKGSANFAVVARGRAAHAGRDFHLGRNAITALARFVLEAETLNNQEKGMSLNIGSITGGGPVNIVPDLATCHLNVRATNREDLEKISLDLQKIVAFINQSEGIVLSLHLDHIRFPKPFDEKNKWLFEQIQECAKEIGWELQCRPSGGVCDGNVLSAEGLPTIDTLGVIGGNLHTPEEYMIISSLVERTKLASLLLLKLASGDIKVSIA